MTNTPGERIPARTPGCQTDRLGEETLVFCPARSETIYLNDTAALVWSLCDGARTVQQIVDLLSAAYPDAAGRVAVDVDQTLRLLQQRGAVRLT